MAKGIFSQTLCLLTDRVIPLEEIAAALPSFTILGSPGGTQDWQISAPSLVLAYRPEVNGKVTVDFVDQRWPDAMGEEKSDKTTFSAWSMGYFGPFTYPNNLLRAGQHSWSWQPGRSIAQAHTGFIRIRSSYVFGGDPKAPVLPKDYQAVPELEFVTGIALALLEVPGTLCYFNPGGEVLRDKTGLQELLADFKELQMPPLPAWCNIRFFKLNEDWFVMDTIGNHQLDIPDLETIFRMADYQPAQIDNYLRDVSMYMLKGGADVLKDGDKIDGPGETDLSWQVTQPGDPISDPPRPLFQLTRTADQDAIQRLAKRA